VSKKKTFSFAVPSVSTAARPLPIRTEARDPTLATVVQDVHYYAPQDIRFGMRYADIVSFERDGTPVADLRRIGAMEPDVGDREEAGWAEWDANG
jgi:inward rectifier potassium channel